METSYTFSIALDNCTGFILGITALASQTATEMKQEFWRLVCQYGPPKFVISDNGGEFTGAIFTKLLEQLRVEHRLIASYHPNPMAVSKEQLRISS